jgi:hypothetical protein
MTTEVKSSDWAFWTLEAPNGRSYLAFAPVEGPYRDPSYEEAAIIRPAMEGHCEISEWVFHVDCIEDISISLKNLGFIYSSKASHLLDYMMESGSFLPDLDWDEDVDVEDVWVESRRHHAQNPDSLLQFCCPKCNTLTPGKMQDVKTGCCEKCSGEDYDPYVPKESW